VGAARGALHAHAVLVHQHPPTSVCRVMPTPPWRQPRGKWMVSGVNSHLNVASRR
jgi:disulfide bond formation protein DsbB